LEGQASSFDDDAFAPMVSLEMNVAMFKSEWQFCDRTTEYLSEILGQGHSDPARYSNFLSFATNELIELGFRSTGELGRIRFSLYRSAKFNRLRIVFPCENTIEREQLGAQSDEAQPGRSADGGQLVMAGERAVWLRDLAAIFRAAIRIEADGGHGVQIIADFPSAEEFR
jgi:hypothetical protein